MRQTGPTRRQCARRLYPARLRGTGATEDYASSSMLSGEESSGRRRSRSLDHARRHIIRTCRAQRAARCFAYGSAHTGNNNSLFHRYSLFSGCGDLSPRVVDRHSIFESCDESALLLADNSDLRKLRRVGLLLTDRAILESCDKSQHSKSASHEQRTTYKSRCHARRALPVAVHDPAFSRGVRRPPAWITFASQRTSPISRASSDEHN